MEPMVHILRKADQRKGAIADVEFEGFSHGSAVSFFIGDLAPGNGPPLHKHPYSETCIVRAGRVAIDIGGEEIVGEAGDIVVIDPGTAHGFKAIGEERLQMICIHASDRFVIDWIA